VEVSVLVPFGGVDPDRVAALEWLLPQFPPGWQVVVGHCEGAWCKAVAVSDALTRATGDLLVIHDADVWSPGTPLAASQCDTWAVPHRNVHRFDQHATRAVLAGAEPSESVPGRDQPPYEGLPGGGIVMVRRDIYEQVPIDPRFVGWGQEDAAHGEALRSLHGPPLRLEHPLFHLWHEPQPRMNRTVGSIEGKCLLNAYRRAALEGPHAMRRLLEEVPCRSTVS